jgi:conjugal transfer pilus assembly protein TraF
MSRLLSVALPALCLSSLWLPVAGAGPAQARFYERGAEGWFWYAEEPPEPEPEPAPEAPPPPQEPASPPAIAEQPPPPPPAATAPPVPAPLSAAWLRANLEHYRDRAIDDPTPRNVALYLYLQRLTLDKAERFAEASQRVVWSDPLLDETTRRPLATFAANLVNRTAGAAQAAALTETSKVAGLWFLFRSDCPYCEAQAPLLAVLAARHGFRIQAVSLDGKPLPGGFFPDYRRDQGQARALGVVATPALFLARPPTDLVPLAQGVLSLEELEARIVNAATEAGWIAPQWRERTRARVTDLRMDATGLDAAALAVDPDRLLAQLRGLIQPPSNAVLGAP